MCTTAQEEIIRQMAPTKALEKQRRYMRRGCRKPTDMTIRQYVSRMIHINDKELPMLPPFAATNSLTDAEMIDIVLYGMPNSWEQEMAKQGHDPLVMTLGMVTEFCERLETAEDFDKKPKAEVKNQKSSKKKKTSHHGSSDGDKYCLIHGNNPTHDSNSCRVLKAQVAKGAKKEGFKKDGKSNGSWKSKADYAKNQTKGDLATYVKKIVRKELNAFTQELKRKADDSDEDMKSAKSTVSDVEDYENYNFDDIDMSETFEDAEDTKDSSDK
jgi:hypothetical protein